MTVVAECDRKQGILFTAAIISTGLTFHSVHELFLRAHMKMPVGKGQFYAYQKSFCKFIAGYATTLDQVSWGNGKSMRSLITLNSSARNSILDDRCEHRRGTPVKISIDGRWTSRRQAMEGTVTCFDADT